MIFPLSSFDSSQSSRGTYHHGDLRAALLATAQSMVRSTGSDNVSVRGVAREAGVSHAAAYYHFTDKRHLLASLAVSAFEDLTSTLSSTLEKSTPDSVLQDIGRAYLSFALTRPVEFRFMFRRDLCEPGRKPDPLEAAGLAALFQAERGIKMLHVDEPLSQEAVHTQAITFWALIHGVTTIVTETPAFSDPNEAAAQELMKASIQTLIDGAMKGEPVSD